MEIKSILNRPVLSLYEGEMLGIVNELWFDKKLKNLTAIELKNEEDISLIITSKNIYHTGKNALTIKNSEYAQLKESIEPLDYVSNPIGHKVYTITGELKGVIKDIELDEKYVIQKIVLENGVELDLTKLANCSKNTVLIYDESTTVNINKFKQIKKPKFFKSKKSIPVTALPIVSEPPKVEDPSESVDKTSTIERVEKIYTPTNIVLPNTVVKSSSFIIGRKANKDIFGFNNEIIIKKNTKITQNTINIASKFGKLKELMIYSE